VADVPPHHPLEMTSGEDEHPIHAFSSHCSHEPLRHGVGPGCPDWCADHGRVFGPEDVVKGPRELRVAVAHEIPHVVELTRDGQVPPLLRDPRRVGMSGDAGEVNAPGSDLDEEQHVQRPQPRRLHGEEVACPDALCLGTEESRPSRAVAAGSGPDAGSSQDRADRRGPDPDPQLAELALDPHASPHGVLPTHTDHKVSEVGVDARSTGGLLPAVGPLAANELAVPAQERLRSDQERRPAVARQDSAGCCEEDAVEAMEPRTLHPSTQDRQLVTEHSVLDLEVTLA